MSAISQRFQVGGAPLSAYPRGTLYHIVNHYLPEGYLDERVWLEPTPPSVQDAAIAERLCNIYYRVCDEEVRRLKPEDRPNSGIWEMTKHEFQGEIYRLLAARDVQGVTAYMRGAMRESITHGMGCGEMVFDSVAHDPDGRRFKVIQIADRLASLAEACCALPYENPEQGRYGQNVTLGMTQLVHMIQNKIGVEITRPAVMGNFGFEVDNQIVDFRVPDDAYTGYRVHSLLKLLKRSMVCEIGAGLGGNAIQAFRHGLSRYTIVDLPITNLVQGWFLMSILGPDRVRMYGEPDQGQFVSILPYWEFHNPQVTFDFVVNRDSLPEIPQQHAQAYIDEIARRECAFLSINQESKNNTDQVTVLQLAVNELVAANGELESFYRCPSWIRKGYVEELYLPKV